MTAIDTTRALAQARLRLTSAAARRAATAGVAGEGATAPRVRHTRASLPRHDDSGAHTSLESAMDSAFSCNMETAIETVPDDVGAARVR